MSTAGFDDAREFWNKRYAADEYIFGVEPNAFLLTEKARFHSGMRVLDLACGEGRNSVWLARMGCDVVGVDISPLALAKARRLAAELDVTPSFIEGDLRQRNWESNAFDAVLTIFIQFAAPEGRQVLFEGIRRTLKPSGLLFVQGFTPAQLTYQSGGPKELSHLYTADLLRGMVGNLQILHLREHHSELNEGSKHVGMAALVDMIAGKPG